MIVSGDEPRVSTTTDEPLPYGLTPQAYLVRERAAKYRSEYFDGELVAMAGAPEPHVTITGNIFAHLYFRLKPPCRAYQTELKVQVESGSGYAYPDVLVVCGAPRFVDSVHDALSNPAVVFEVLSPSTERHDRTTKAKAYERVESLQAYVFISQREPRVEVYARAADGSWPCTVYQGLDATVRLDAIGCGLTLSETYRDFVFPAARRQTPAPHSDTGAVSPDEE